VDQLVNQGYTIQILTRECGVVDLGQNIAELHAAASEQLRLHGTCLELLFTPFSNCSRP